MSDQQLEQDPNRQVPVGLDMIHGLRWTAQQEAETKARALNGVVLASHHALRHLSSFDPASPKEAYLGDVLHGHFHSTSYEFSGTIRVSGPWAKRGEVVSITIFPGLNHPGPLTPNEVFLAYGLDLSFPDSVLTHTTNAILVNELLGIGSSLFEGDVRHADEAGHFMGSLEDTDRLKEYFEDLARDAFAFNHEMKFDPQEDTLTLLAHGYLPDGTRFPLLPFDQFKLHGGPPGDILYGVIRHLDPDREVCSGKMMPLDEGAFEVPEVVLASRGGGLGRELLSQIGHHHDMSVQVVHPYHMDEFMPERTVARQRSFSLSNTGIELYSRATPLAEKNNFLIGVPHLPALEADHHLRALDLATGDEAASLRVVRTPGLGDLFAYMQHNDD